MKPSSEPSFRSILYKICGNGAYCELLGRYLRNLTKVADRVTGATVECLRKVYRPQICIICFLVFVLGGKAILWHPEWFDQVSRNDDLHDNLDQAHMSASAAKPFFTLGSATSTADSGFLDYVLPIFRAATGLDVRVEAVGTERALAIAARGDVDALLVHDRQGEDNLVAYGYGIDRRDVMHDDFVIVGRLPSLAGEPNWRVPTATSGFQLPDCRVS
jgi:hypothetical protein